MAECLRFLTAPLARTLRRAFTAAPSGLGTTVVALERLAQRHKPKDAESLAAEARRLRRAGHSDSYISNFLGLPLDLSRRSCTALRLDDAARGAALGASARDYKGPNSHQSAMCTDVPMSTSNASGKPVNA